MMAARVMALAVSITLFVAVWSSDQRQPREGYLAQLAKQNRQVQTAEIQEHQSHRLIASNSIESHRSPAEIESGPQPLADDDATEVVAKTDIEKDDEPTLALGDRGIDDRLPEGIAPGTYRVVTSTGSVRNLILTANDLELRELRTDAEPQDLYVLHGRGERAYFIRIDTHLRITDADPE